MSIVVRDFLQVIEKFTSDSEIVLMILRTVGPDSCDCQEKYNEIYSSYKSNFDVESDRIFNTFLRNEWSFLEFETEEEAVKFAKENLPVSKENIDEHYFVQCFVFNRGALAFSNDSLSVLSHRIPQ